MSKTLIVYASKYGCTEKAALLLKSRLREAEAVNLKDAKVPALNEYGTVILGSPIYYGKIRREMAAFTSKHGQELLNKRLGLFICAGMTGEKGEQELQQAYPDALYKCAVAKDILGDEVYPERISAVDKWVLRMVRGKGNEAGAGLSMERLEGFARALTESN